MAHFGSGCGWDLIAAGDRDARWSSNSRHLRRNPFLLEHVGNYHADRSASFAKGLIMQGHKCTYVIWTRGIKCSSYGADTREGLTIFTLNPMIRTGDGMNSWETSRWINGTLPFGRDCPNPAAGHVWPRDLVILSRLCHRWPQPRYAFENGCFMLCLGFLTQGKEYPGTLLGKSDAHQMSSSLDDASRHLLILQVCFLYLWFLPGEFWRV